MIYGANGYSGSLLAQEAIKKGHEPILAGRSQDKLANISKILGLEHRVFNLKDEKKLNENIKECEVILNAAGPFIHTSKPIVEACIETGTNYIDITGELSVFEQNFQFDQKARNASIAIISGVGFDVVPTDCMAMYISKKVLVPIRLDIAISGMNDISRGTLKTTIESLSHGTFFRRNGLLVQKSNYDPLKKVRFYDQERDIFPVSWGDLSTAYKSTGVPNITTYMPYSKQLSSILKTSQSFVKSNNNKSEREQVLEWIDKNIYGPDENIRNEGRSHIWVRVTGEGGDKAEAWLETIEPYRFTFISGVSCVERILKSRPIGSLTPSMAFGENFVLSFPDTYRYDNLD